MTHILKQTWRQFSGSMITGLVLTLALTGCGSVKGTLGKIKGGQASLDPIIGATPPPGAVLTPQVDTNKAPSDGDTAAVIVITIRDSNGSPLVGYTPTVTAPNGVVVVCHESDSQGRASCHVSSTQPGVVQLEVQPADPGNSGGGGSGGGGSGGTGGGSGGGSGGGGAPTGGNTSVVTLEFTEKKAPAPGTMVSTGPVVVASGGTGTISVAGSVGQVASPIVLDDGFNMRALINIVGDWFH